MNLYANQIERIINISQYQQVVTGHILKSIRIITYNRTLSDTRQNLYVNVQDWELSEDNPIIPSTPNTSETCWMIFDPVDRTFKYSDDLEQTFDHKIWIVTKNKYNQDHIRYGNTLLYYIDEIGATVQGEELLPTNWVPDYPTSTP